MDAKTLFDALRAMHALTSLVQNWLASASPDQVKALVAEAHARGETIDAAFLRNQVADMSATVDALDAKVKAAGG